MVTNENNYWSREHIYFNKYFEGESSSIRGASDASHPSSLLGHGLPHGTGTGGQRWVVVVLIVFVIVWYRCKNAVICRDM